MSFANSEKKPLHRQLLHQALSLAYYQQYLSEHVAVSKNAVKRDTVCFKCIQAFQNKLNIWPVKYIPFSIQHKFCGPKFQVYLKSGEIL